MNLSFEVYIVVIMLLIYIDAILILKLVANRLKSAGRRDAYAQERKNLVKYLLKDSNPDTSWNYISSYKKMRDSVNVDEKEKECIDKCLDIDKIERKNIRRLKSIFQVRRMEAAVNLGLISSERSREALEKAMVKEKSFPVRLYMANALADIGSEKSIPVLIASLVNAHRWYRNRVNMLIASFGASFHQYLPQIVNREEAEIKELIVDFSDSYTSRQLKEYLVHIIDKETVIYSQEKYNEFNKLGKCCGNCVHGRERLEGENRLCKYKGAVSVYYSCWRFRRLPISIDGSRSRKELAYRAAEVIATYYPELLDDDKYLSHEDYKIRNIAVKALVKDKPYENFDRVIGFLYDEKTAESSADAISKSIDEDPKLIDEVINRFVSEKNFRVRTCLAEILSRRIEYFIVRLVSKNKKSARDIIELILLAGKNSEVINFLNKNGNLDIENELVAIIRGVIAKDKSLESEFGKYLNERLLKKCRIDNVRELETERTEKKNKESKAFIYSTMVLVVLIFPIMYVFRHYSELLKLPFITQLETYIIEFNYYMIFYSVAISLIYMVLLLLSTLNVRKQSKLWKLKSMTFLFKKRMLPGISIIAPTFNEEKTIIESANSLLNLVYPDYELVIVNDGSKDETIDVLIKHFDLKRVDYNVVCKLNTKRVKGIYMNKSIPKLIVVDKENGGKADSLNAGINIARKEYFCGIDADSLLESDALLKLASMELDSGLETPALGGNILPINGCAIDKGEITDIKVPKNNIARFQTIEYIRAFMAGRLGWAYTNNLLIISGAFGLFRKERVVSVGGYLTSSGEYEKDTVGEDMELVVRIGRLMREKNLRYKIDYAYNANCWTEVPEEMKSLKSQRYRWHRGLVDIMTFHKRMILNPRYGRTGLVAMPYFFIFEMAGPFIETQGYVMVLAAFLLGLLNAQVALLLFISTILMGVLISISSLLISERDTESFNLKDTLKLSFYAVIENFGPRQLFSLWRVVATFRILWKTEGWGKVERKGFASRYAAKNESDEEGLAREAKEYTY